MHKHESTKNPSATPHVDSKAAPVAVIGARGYSGLELCRILLRHPGVQLTAVSASDDSFQLGRYLPEAAAQTVPTLATDELVKGAQKFAVIFLATPAEVSLELAPALLAKGAHVIDLSGAFRLKGADAAESQGLYKKWYGFSHAHPALTASANYGLVPFAGPLTAKAAQLIANPGCFVTSVLMPLVPLLQSKVIDPTSLVIDAKSGTTGAGRKASESLLFTEVDGDLLPYKVGQHQHFPEIVEGLRQFAGVEIDPMFTTQLLPVRRGIQSAIYARLRPGKSAANVAQAFVQAYASYPLVKIAEIGAPESTHTLPLKKVVGTARTHLSWKVDGEKLYVFSNIDNLLKGAASQAVENLNRLVDLPVETGLDGLEGVL